MEEYKDVAYRSEEDYLEDRTNIRMLHNKLLIEDQNQGYVEENSAFI